MPFIPNCSHRPPPRLRPRNQFFNGLLATAVKDSPFYSAWYRARHADTTQSPTVEDWAALPVVTPEQLGDDPLAFVVPHHVAHSVVVATSSGTTGSSKTVLHSTHYTSCEAAHNRYFGIDPASHAAVIGRYGSLSFVSGVAAYRSIGMRVLPLGMRHAPSYYAHVFRMARTCVIRSRPSFLRYLAAQLHLVGVDARELGIKHLVLTDHGAMPQHLDELRTRWGSAVHIAYGSTEAGPIGYSCRIAPGLHIHADSVYVEIVPFKNGASLSHTEPGQLLLSTLRNPAMPLLRYRQGDAGHWDASDCRCGNATPRLILLGRVMEAFDLGPLGTRVYPIKLAESLASISGLTGNLSIRIRGCPGQEEVCLLVGRVACRGGQKEAVEASFRALDRHLAREVEAGTVRLTTSFEDELNQAAAPEKPRIAVQDDRHVT